MDGDFSRLSEEADEAMGQDCDQRQVDDIAMRIWVRCDLKRQYSQVLDERLPAEWLELLPRD